MATQHISHICRITQLIPQDVSAVGVCSGGVSIGAGVVVVGAGVVVVGAGVVVVVVERLAEAGAVIAASET
jgi:hypothetical protein